MLHSDQSNPTTLSSRLPLFTIKRDFESSSTEKTVKLEQSFNGGNKVKKLECPVSNGASIKGKVYTLAEFLKIAEELQFDTGPELFDKFCLVLHKKH